MKFKRVATIVILSIVGLIVVLIAVRFATIKRRATAASIEEIQAAEGTPVDVQVARRGTISRYMEMLGTVQGVEQVNISSALPIDITRIAKREGDRVRKGEVVILLARDRPGRAFHQYTTAKQALDNARKDLERTENLHHEGAVPGQTLEQARLAYENAKAQFDQAASTVDLVSPIDGVVTMINATEGSEAVPGVTLATVAALDRMRIRCQVGHAEVAHLSVGQKAFVAPPADAGRASGGRTGAGGPPGALEGEVTRVSLSSDPETNLFLVEIMCDNPGGELRPGLVTATLVLVEEKPDALKMTSDALVRREGKHFVYRVASGHARLTEVTLGPDSGDFVDLETGVAEGDTIVFRGQSRLTDNARVKIRGVEGTD